MQPAGQIVDPNQYYYAAVPPQPTAHQQNVSYQYTGAFFADPYMVTPTPSQSSQPVIMPVGPPGFIYMPPPSTPVYYSVPTATAAPATTAPYYYTPDVYVQQAVSLPQQIIQPQAVMPGEAPMNKMKSTVRPLSTSTPLPTEFASIPPPMTNQLPYAGHINVAHLKYYRNMDQDDVLANLSKISIVSEETIEAENEKDCEHRPARQRRPPPVPFNYKTRMCLTYASGKNCEMGNRCKFAHGPEELRVVDAAPRAPNARYKTKLCKNFGPYAANYCPYGHRCEFIHPSDKEYALVCSATSQPSRNPHIVGNLSQNVCNITPETVCEMPQISVTRSAIKPAAEKILLKNRNIAGSMMCLASIGRREQQISDDSAIGSGSSESGGSCAHVKALTRAREGLPATVVPIKFLRRRSMSQLTLKRFNSIENLDVAASCSQLANLEQNRKPLGLLSPLK